MGASPRPVGRLLPTPVGRPPSFVASPFMAEGRRPSIRGWVALLCDGAASCERPTTPACRAPWVAGAGRVLSVRGVVPRPMLLFPLLTPWLRLDDGVEVLMPLRLDEELLRLMLLDELRLLPLYELRLELLLDERLTLDELWLLPEERLMLDELLLWLPPPPPLRPPPPRCASAGVALRAKPIITTATILEVFMLCSFLLGFYF